MFFLNITFDFGCFPSDLSAAIGQPVIPKAVAMDTLEHQDIKPDSRLTLSGLYAV